MVELVNLTKRYDDILAVDNLSFEVRSGEVFGLLGSNGAGKTTTLQMIAGLLKPTSGEIFVSGMNITEHALRIKSMLGYLPESPAVYEQLLGREFLSFIGRLRGLSEEEISARVENLARIIRQDEPAVIYCNGTHCSLSYKAVTKAVQWGFTNIRYYREGMKDWRRSGNPIESTPQ